MAKATSKKIYFWTLLAVAVAGGIIALLTLRGGAEEMPGLFADVPEADVPSEFLGHNIAKRHRWVRLNPDGWQNVLQIGDRFRLNLFPDLDLTGLVAQHQTQHHGDQGVMAVVESQPADSLVVLGRSGDLLCGRVTLADGRQFEINHVRGDLYVILEVDPTRVGKCGVCETPSVASREHQRKHGSNGDAAALSRRIASARRGNDGIDRCGACGQEQFLPTHIPPTTVATVEADAPLPYFAPPHPISRHDIARARLQPSLAALRVPSSLLAANKWRVHDREGNPRRENTIPQDVLDRFKAFETYQNIDILFLYTAGAGATQAAVQPQINAALLEANQYLLESRIPIKLRQVTDGGTTAWKANHRAMTAMGDGSLTDPNLLGSGYPKDAPAWEVNPADSTITRPDYRNPTGDAQIRWRGLLSQWPKANAASYVPKFVDAQENSLTGYMQWLTNRSNSLMFGDQYWEPGKFYVGYEIKQVEVNATNQNFETHSSIPTFEDGTSLPDGWPVYWIGEVPDISHSKPTWTGRPINLDQVI